MTIQQTHNSALWHSMADGYSQLIQEVGSRKFGENEALDEIGAFVLERAWRKGTDKSELEMEINQWVIELKKRYSP